MVEIYFIHCYWFMCVSSDSCLISYYICLQLMHIIKIMQAQDFTFDESCKQSNV